MFLGIHLGEMAREMDKQIFLLAVSEKLGTAINMALCQQWGLRKEITVQYTFCDDKIYLMRGFPKQGFVLKSR